MAEARICSKPRRRQPQIQVALDGTSLRSVPDYNRKQRMQGLVMKCSRGIFDCCLTRAYTSPIAAVTHTAEIVRSPDAF